MFILHFLFFIGKLAFIFFLVKFMIEIPGKALSQNPAFRRRMDKKYGGRED